MDPAIIDFLEFAFGDHLERMLKAAPDRLEQIKGQVQGEIQVIEALRTHTLKPLS